MVQTVLDEIPAAVAKADNLPSIPGVALEILRLTRDENAGIDDYAEVLSNDPALAAKLLKLSNSSLFGVGNGVTNVKQATMVLGIKTVQLMSLSFSMTTAVDRDEINKSFDFAMYWRRSLIASVAGRSLCRLLNINLEAEAFMCGLLSNIGQLVMVQCIPEDYAAILAESKGWPTAEEELAFLGYDHCALGAALLRSWELPTILTDAINYMNEPESLPEGSDEQTVALAEVLSLANLVVRILCDEDKGACYAKLHVATQERGIPDEQTGTFLLDLESVINETADVLDLELSAATDHSAIVEDARDQMMQISLGTAACLKQEERRSADLKSENRDLAAKAETDKLTGIANRAGFDAVIESEVKERINDGTPNALGLLIIDVDKFKVFNDTHGHQAGDEVLRIVGRIMGKVTRSSDLAARYGGEEFSIIVPQTTPFALRCYAERVRREIESTVLPIDEKTLSITVSIGGACLSRSDNVKSSVTALIEAADQCLYRCKENGRNCYEVENEVLDFATGD